MPESQLILIFIAIVQLESGGNIKARNEDAYGPAQIKPAVVQDVQSWGHTATLKDRGTLDGSYRLFALYTDRWIAKMGLPDTAEVRASIWRHGPNSAYVRKPNAYATRVKSLMQDPDLRWAHPDSRKWLADRQKGNLRR